jgi:hypothetical protein
VYRFIWLLQDLHVNLKSAQITGFFLLHSQNVNYYPGATILNSTISIGINMPEW